jgi:catechol 2,3-dioxygenase-like lactoylglutathione lyase family enzyme
MMMQCRILNSLVLTLLLLGHGTLPAAEADLLGAVGIGVSDLEASAAFYQDVLGLEVQQTFALGYLDEIVLGYPDADGAALVLMHWPDQPRRYDGNDVKVVFYVEDPAGVIERIRARGGRIDREASPIDVLPGRVVGLARDPDNYVIEVIDR